MLLVLFFVLVGVVKCEECGYYLAPSFIPGAARGIIAGKDYVESQLVESTPSMLVPNEEIRKFQLFNYVYSSNDDQYSIVVFGAAMLFNHRNPKTVTHFWHDTVVPNSDIIFNIFGSSHTNYSKIDYYTVDGTPAGQELFASYGDGDEWFTSRRVPLSEYIREPSHIYTIDYLRQYGHCMTDLYIDISPIPMAGLGVFTKKAFKKGEVVSISPVIVVPRHSVEKISQKTLLLNYLVCSEGSDGAMLPFGIAGMANHGGVKANVKIEWHQWDALDGKEPPVNHLDWDISKLEALPFAPLDFKYVALRDIAEGEELLLSYGEQWERAWMRYLGEMKVWIEKNGVSSIALKPQFREPITAPKGFFPPNFDADCIGATGCKKSRANKRSKNPVKSQFVDAPDIELAREYAKSNFNVLVLDEL